MRTLTRLLVITAVLVLMAGPALFAAPLAGAGMRLTATTEHRAVPRSGLELLLWPLAVGAAIKIGDTAKLALKYKTRAGAAQADYKAGVETAGADWEAGARAGEGNYVAGVQESISKGRYGKGIANAGAAKYVKNAVDLGVQRYPQGVAQGTDAWARGVQPAFDKLKSLQLPPKGPKRSPQNQQRANMVALELGKLKDAS